MLNEQTKILLKPPFPKQIKRGGGGLNYGGRGGGSLRSLEKSGLSDLSRCPRAGQRERH